MPKLRQMTMPGADTELSVLADEYILAIANVVEAEARIAEVRKGLMTAMRKLNKDHFNHGGRRFFLRTGRKIDSTIVLKQEK